MAMTRLPRTRGRHGHATAFKGNTGVLYYSVLIATMYTNLDRAVGHRIGHPGTWSTSQFSDKYRRWQLAIERVYGDLKWDPRGKRSIYN